jgi:hypothetical protein
MITSTTAKLLKLSSPSTTSSYYLKDRKQVWDYDPLDKTSPASDTVLIGYGGKRFKLAGGLTVISEPPVVTEPPVIVEPPIEPIPNSSYPFFTETPNTAPTSFEVIDMKSKGINYSNDNINILMALNTQYFGEGKPAVRFDFTSLGPGRLKYSHNMWLHGIKNLEIVASGMEMQCTTGAPQHYYQGPFFPGTIFTPWPQGLGTSAFKGWNTGLRISAVEKGSNQIQLLEGSLSVGDKIFFAGFIKQFNGWPPNFKVIGWNEVVNVSGNTVTLKSSLREKLNTQWKDMTRFFSDAQAGAMLGKPRVFKLTNYASYARFVGIKPLAGSVNPNYWENGIYFPGDTVYFEDCDLRGATLWPSENRFIRYNNCLIGPTDLDKCVGTCIFDRSHFYGGIDAATGIEGLIFIDCISDKRAAISPRNMYAKNSIFRTTDGNPSVYSHPEATHIDKVYFEGCETNGVMFSGVGGNGNPQEFIPLSVSASSLTVKDTDNNDTQPYVKAIGFGSTIWTKDGLVKATVKDIIHDGTNYVFQLENIQGVIKAGQAWLYKQTDQVIDLGGNKNGSGQAISIK